MSESLSDRQVAWLENNWAGHGERSDHRNGFPRLSARSAWRSDPGSAGGFPPTRPLARSLARRIACPISMSLYQRSLVSMDG